MTDITDDDIDLKSLSDEELTVQMHDDLYDGLLEEICEGTQILLDRGWGPEKVLSDALVAGMTIVGIDFRDGILFVPEVLLSANRDERWFTRAGTVVCCVCTNGAVLRSAIWYGMWNVGFKISGLPGGARNVPTRCCRQRYPARILSTKPRACMQACSAPARRVYYSITTCLGRRFASLEVLK